MPSTSIVIPVRNGERHVLDAIRSCRAQSLAPTEIIVVDDGSEDGTADLVSRFDPSVIVLQRPWSGAAAALNAGVTRASSAFLAFLDHDDIWVPEKLAVQHAALTASKDLDAVFGMLTQFVSPEVSDDMRERLRPPSEPQAGICASAMLIRRASMMRFGAFEGGRDAGAFLRWQLRAQTVGMRYAVPDPVLVRRRLHANNSGLRDPALNREQYLLAAREMILRRRQDRPGPPRES